MVYIFKTVSKARHSFFILYTYLLQIEYIKINVFFNFIKYRVPMLHFQGVFYRIIVQSQSVKIMQRDEQHNKTSETTKYKFKKRGLGTFFFWLVYTQYAYFIKRKYLTNLHFKIH